MIRRANWLQKLNGIAAAPIWHSITPLILALSISKVSGLMSSYLPRSLWPFSYRNSHRLSSLQTSDHRGFRHTEHSLLRENPKWGSRREINVGLPILRVAARPSKRVDTELYPVRF